MADKTEPVQQQQYDPVLGETTHVTGRSFAEPKHELKIGVPLQAVPLPSHYIEDHADPALGYVTTILKRGGLG